MDTGGLAERLREAAALLDAFPVPADALRVMQRVVNATEAAQVEAVVELTESRGHEAEGCSSVKAWMRDQLHLDAPRAARLVRAARTLRDLPDVSEAASSGAMGLEHLDVFGFALGHIDPQVLAESSGWMMRLAVSAEPSRLKAATRRLRDVAHPEALDDAWMKGMDKHDVHLSPVGDGWHLTGFLPIDTGAKLSTILRSLSAPAGAQDDRPASERRVTALDQLLASVLASGLPVDKGIRPHLEVRLDLTDLTDHPETATAELAGFGTIGPAQLQQLVCGGDLTPVLTAGRHAVLDVGRTARLATRTQRTAVVARQDGQCLGPGCRAPVVHVHHVTYWSDGGATDLTNLVGLCPRLGCPRTRRVAAGEHMLVHAGRLTIDPVTHDVGRRIGAIRAGPHHARAG